MEKNKYSKRKVKNRLRNSFRIYALVLCVFIVVFFVFFRLYNLQISAHAFYVEMAADQHKAYEDLVPKRGEIFVKDGDTDYPVAVNMESSLVYAVPKEIENPDVVAKELAIILGQDEGELKQKLDQPDGWYAVIKHKVEDDKVNEIKEKKFKGIYFSPESERKYPAGNFASHLVGFVGSDGDKVKGRYGLEAYWDEELAGREGKLEQERDTGGRWISISEKKMDPAVDGADIYLTIDHTIQYRAEMAIKNSVEKYQADSASIIVMDPATGAVLALANYPSFNPNEYAKEDMSLFFNPSVGATYECGSVFKPITMAAGLDAGAVTPDTTYTDTGAVHEAGYTIKNSDGKANGVQNMTQVLEKSLNTGVIFVEKQLGNQRFYQYVKNFGFGEKTGFETIGEVSGNISGLKEMRDINSFTASFGQGISVTPIQLITAYAAIANGGKLMKPYAVDKIEYGDGSEKSFAPEERGRVVSREAALDTTRMIVSVVQNGHGKKAGVPGYLVAGKTGTAQVPKMGGGGYEENTHIGSFAGFAPAYDPKFVMLVELNNPKNVEWAESSAAPTFGEMTKFLLDYFGVEPTETYTQKDVDLFNATHDISVYSAEKQEEQVVPPPSESVNSEQKDKDKDKKKKNG
ncbi:MAG: penicillin-binding protein 2 [Parcubacteria group bacterium]|jgi:cell division protein FtsI/penicillin-binding protein 2